MCFTAVIRNDCDFAPTLPADGHKSVPHTREDPQESCEGEAQRKVLAADCWSG